METSDNATEVLLSEEEQEETTYDKGRELEHEFAQYMKANLRWHKVRVGAHLPGKSNRKGASIDVIGEVLDERGEKFHNIAILWLIIAGILLASSLVWAFEDLENGGIGLLIFAVMFAMGGIVFLLQSDKHNKRNAWVECKNLKGKANINQVRKSIEEYKDYKASTDKEYKFDTHYFVSASGYIENALKYALENGIECFEKKENKIVKATYWK